MGKFKVATIGNAEEEQKQKEEARIKREEKKKREAAAKGEKEVEEEVKVEEAPKEEKKSVSKAAHVRGKKYVQSRGKVNKDKVYKLKEAVEILKAIKFAQFDETVELHLNLKEENIKGEAQLPHGTGKTVKAVIATDEVIAEIEKGQVNFDILLATPAMMPKLVKFARVLGPKGLMPNPKNGTVTPKPEEALKKFAGGGIRFKSEPKFPLLHQAVGKSSFEDKALAENITALIKAVGKDKIMEAYISMTMSPSVKLDLNDVK